MVSPMFSIEEGSSGLVSAKQCLKLHVDCLVFTLILMCGKEKNRVS